MRADPTPVDIDSQYKSIREAIDQGRATEAVRECQAVLAAHPQDADALILLGMAGLQLHRADLIEGSLRAAIDLRPRSIEALTLLAGYYRDFMRFADVKDLCLRALAVDDNAPDALVGYGHCLLEEWRSKEALAVFDRAAAADPRSAGAESGRGFALQRLHRIAEAKAAFARAIELEPDDTAAFVGAALAESEAEEAELAFERTMNRFATSASKLAELGRAFWLHGEPKFGERALRRAAEVDPEFDYPRRMLGRVLAELGDFDEARTSIHAAVAASPTSVPLYEELAFAAKFREEDRPFLASMTAILRNRGIDPMDRRRLNFSLGKAYDDLGDYARAAQYFDEANGIGHMQIWPKAFDRGQLTREVDEAIATYTPELFERHAAAANPTEEPIFIVGMLRSGTTLVEQIVSSHPLVAGAGEVMFLENQPIDDAGIHPGVDMERVNAYFDRYLERLRSTAHGLGRITDKLPQNFLRAGLIHLALPNARIVHTRRNPLDTCVSNYVTRSVVAYAHSFSDIAFYYREYERLMAHWRAVLPPNRMVEVDYESLIADRQRLVPELMAFLGLPWDDAVMHPEANKRSVDTLSVWQARQPVYDTSIGRWRRYEAWKGDLLREFPEFAGE